MDLSSAFISYRRQETPFVRQLDAALRASGREIWIDWAAIPPGSLDFQEEIKEGIDRADALIAVLSPGYLISEYCLMELEYAYRSGKRLVPIVAEEVDPIQVPSSISHINWVHFNRADPFEVALQKTEQALDTDYAHVDRHTQLLVRARQWEKSAHDASLLLRGNELRRAETWLRQGKSKQPQPIDLHLDYVKRSRRASNRRLVQSVAAFLIVAVIIGLAIFAFYQRFQAIQAERVARSLALGSSALVVLDDNNNDLAIALALGARELGGETEIANERALATVAYAPGTRRVFNGHADTVRGVVFIPNSRWIISASQDDTLIIWDEDTGEIIRRLEGHSGDVRGIAISVDGALAASGSADNTVIVWDIASGQALRTLNGHTKRIRSVAFSPDANTILSAAEDGTAKLWNTYTGDLVVTLEPPSGATVALDVAFSPDGATALVGYNNGAIVWWDLFLQAPVKTLTGHEGWVESVVFAPDGEHALSGSRDLTIRYWNLIDSTSRTFLGHTDWVLGVDVSRDGRFALSASEDETIRIWDLVVGIEVQRFEGHTDGVWEAIFSSDTTTDEKPAHILSGSSDGTVRLWDVNSQAQAKRFNAEQPAQIIALAVNPDASTFIFGTQGGRLQAWGVDSPEAISLTGGHLFSAINAVAISPDESLALSAADDATIAVWRLSEGRVAFKFEQHEQPVTAVIFTPDSQQVLSGDESGRLILWNAYDGSVVRVFDETGEHHSSQVNDIVIFGTVAATASDGNQVLLWDINTGLAIGSLQGHQDAVRSLVFNHDGTRLFSASADEVIILWDVAERSIIRRYLGHTEGIFSIDYRRDTEGVERIISGAGDLTVRVWDVGTGQELRRFEGHTSRVTQVQFGNGGSTAISTGLDGTIRYWRVDDSDTLVEWTEQNRFVRALEPEECRVYQVEELCGTG